MADITFVIGGARSGKSAFAEAEVLACSDKQAVYVATAQALDDEMKNRILLHQQRRDQRWLLVEEAQNLSSVIQQYNSKKNCLLIDCLTLWLNNMLFDESRDWILEKQTLLTTLENSQAKIIIVSNEIGQGVIPLGEENRYYVDELGWLNQAVAKISGKAVLMAAGLPLILKNNP